MALLARLSSWFTESSEPEITVDNDVVEPARAYDELRSAIEPARRGLVEHPIYDAVDSLPALRIFMQAHVFAVWDFMCLAKRLQRDLTSMSPLWRPPAMPELARFINGVILGEESDDGPEHEAISHCELYIAAMDEVGASTAPVRRFLELIAEGVEVEVALSAAGAPRPARAFVRRTLEYALGGDTVEVLSAFLFGREDLIPDMFRRILPRWQASCDAPRFAYYVQRHIDLDGDDHGPAAQRALIQLAGRDRAAWAAARQVATDAIAARTALWDRVHADLE
jgi:hypothetical protein